jgi:hypothetical protein
MRANRRCALMHALARLIHERRAADPSLSYAQIARLSGGRITKSAVGKWASDEERLDGIPQPPSIAGFAQALNVSQLRVLLAAAEAAGIEVTDPGSGFFAGRLPVEIDDLPEVVQESLLHHIWTLISATENTNT